MSKINKENSHQGVGIVGAGLVGCLAALAFAAKGYSVTLFEGRPDPAENKNARSLRSINLAVSDRGIRALKYVDNEIATRILEHVIPMKGRMIHHRSGTQESQLYGLYGEAINSIDRGYLNDYLLDEIRHLDINVLFNHKLIKLSNLSNESTTPTISFLDTTLPEGENIKSFEFDYIVGADGAHSQFRYQMQKSMRMNFSQEYIDMQYLELYIPPNDSPNASSKFHLNENHLHIWPRKEFMLIALANEDGSFTSTFFSPWSVIESIKTGVEFVEFFKENFPDAVELIGEQRLLDTYENNPRGSLMQVSVYPYNDPTGRAIIIGDAAHLMVPFYGQGMNCGFEDVRVLMELIEKNNNNIPAAFKQYSETRHEDLKVICKLALDNYYEMSSKVTNIWYLLRKKLDYVLGKYFNGSLISWIPMYTMISFRGDIPYSKAAAIERKQSRILNQLQIGTISTIIAVGVFKAVNYWQKLNKQ